MDKNFFLRLGFGLLYAALVLFCTTGFWFPVSGGRFSFLPGQEYLFYGLMTLFMVISLIETLRMLRFGNFIWKLALFPAAAAVYYSFSERYFHRHFSFRFNMSELLGIFLIFLSIFTLFRSPRELYDDRGKFIFVISYVVLPFGFALGLPRYQTEVFFSSEVFMLFVLIWSSDVFAYLTGKTIGKNRMAPRISPAKTWEGAFGGVLCTIVLGFFIEKYYPTVRGNWIVIGCLVSVTAPLGDLAESQLKRSFGVKDSGKIIPGHGGILDRLDSFILCAPVLYLYFMLENFFS